jgi:glycosyltransferase involved in cell wall biosynthesis
VRQWIAERELKNVELVIKRVDDMAAEYNGAHVTIAPFTDIHRSKPAPNSLVESAACGRPVLTSEIAGLADAIREGAAGVVSRVTGEELAQNLDRLAADWKNYSRAARKLAEAHFGLENFLEQYRRLYADVLGN